MRHETEKQNRELRLGIGKERDQSVKPLRMLCMSMCHRHVTIAQSLFDDGSSATHYSTTTQQSLDKKRSIQGEVKPLSTKILRINTAGIPMEWIGWQEAVVLHARDLVSWSYGESVKDVFGGYSKTGKRSVISLNSVLASRGKVVNADMKTSLSNATLFRRDQHTCLYCGLQFPATDLSRDHVHPVSRVGRMIGRMW